MKKVGIITMHRVVNYGSFLQAYALKKTIESFGYNVEFIDFHYEKSLVSIKKIPLVIKIYMNRNVINYIKRKRFKKELNGLYQKSLAKYLNVTKVPNYNKNINCLIIGSDEVFNCMQGYPVGYSKELFGKNFDEIKVITYAASFGHTRYFDLKKHNIDFEVGNLLKKMKSISVRDRNSYQIVSRLTHTLPAQHLDPVLIGNFDNELINITVTKSNYIVLYAYEGRLKKDEENYIKQISKEKGKKIVSIGFYQKIADYNLILTPFEVLAYIKHADYVITDTFHGTIFSIKMKSKFCTIIRESNKNKLLTLLKKLRLEHRSIKNNEDIQKLYDKEIDYSEVENIINFEIDKSIKYLKENI